MSERPRNSPPATEAGAGGVAANAPAGSQVNPAAVTDEERTLFRAEIENLTSAIKERDRQLAELTAERDKLKAAPPAADVEAVAKLTDERDKLKQANADLTGEVEGLKGTIADMRRRRSHKPGQVSNAVVTANHKGEVK